MARRSQQKGPGYKTLTQGERFLRSAIQSFQTLSVLGYFYALALAPRTLSIHCCPHLRPAEVGGVYQKEGRVEMSQVSFPLTTSILKSPYRRCRDLTAPGERKPSQECQVVPPRSPYPRVHGRQCFLVRTLICL